MISLFIPASIFIFGLIVGSFLNAVIYRLNSGDSIVIARSKCVHCGHVLAWYDLVPLASFLFLRGHCRYCGGQISWQYPLVELATAAAFVLVYLNTVSLSSLTTYYLLLTTCFLIIIFVYDLKHYLIMDKVVFPAAALAVVYQLIEGRFLDGLISAGILSGFFAFLFFASRGRWIGFGDVKLGLFLGFLAPFPETLALFMLAYVIGAAVSLALLAFGGRKMSDRLPFGTFLTLAAFIAMIWGEEIVNWYFQLIGVRL